MKRVYVALLVSGFATAASAQVPTIDLLSVGRSGDDLVVSWTPVFPADGYRVYRSENLDCSGDVLVYDGVDTTYVDPGAMIDFTTQLYRVVAYSGADESLPSVPVYKYAMLLPNAGAHTPGRLVSPPYAAPALDAAGLCAFVNDDFQANTPLLTITRYNPDNMTYTTLACASPLQGYSIKQESYLMMPGGGMDQTIVLAGVGDDSWPVELPEVRADSMPFPPCEYYTNLFWVLFPYDHDYADLMDVANDIPSVVDVRVFDGEECLFDNPGLTRMTSTDPWTGTNLPLAGRRGEGLMIAVDSPTTWFPRRLCIGPRMIAPGRVESLTVEEDGDDLIVYWDEDPLAASYDLYRLDDKMQLLDPMAQPVYQSVSAGTSSYRDVGAGLVPGTIMYQMAVIDSQGREGPF